MSSITVNGKTYRKLDTDELLKAIDENDTAKLEEHRMAKKLIKEADKKLAKRRGELIENSWWMQAFKEALAN